LGGESGREGGAAPKRGTGGERERGEGRQSVPDDLFEVHPVSTAVNKVSNDGPELEVHAAYPDR
jgi:putative SOS response-associated peptidase YedK